MLSQTLIDLMEKGHLPDSAIRYGIRRLCAERLKSLSSGSLETDQLALNAYVENLRKLPLAVHTKEANEQHYELPPQFFNLVLGKHRKYSSCYFAKGNETLTEAETDSLELTVKRAELENGQRILELGCGWGSLSLFMASKFPEASITAISNSAPQREFIEGEAKSRGIKNLTVLTRNIVDVIELEKEFPRFDRVVSVEMFEHLKNYALLFERISHWLKPEGKLFAHVFTHKTYAYPFEVEGEDNWMGKYFFTGGQMPSHGLFLRFQDHLAIQNQWAWDGRHYAQTSEEWLNNLDSHRTAVMGLFKEVYGKDSERWFNRWRVFFLSCAELFGYDQGQEWGVSHYLFRNRSPK